MSARAITGKVYRYRYKSDELAREAIGNVGWVERGILGREEVFCVFLNRQFSWLCREEYYSYRDQMHAEFAGRFFLTKRSFVPVEEPYDGMKAFRYHPELGQRVKYYFFAGTWHAMPQKKL